MDLRWSFALPTSEKSRDYHFESPILVCKNEVLFAFGYRDCTLYVINTDTGEGKELPLNNSIGMSSRNFFFAPASEGAVIYTGDLHLYRDGAIVSSCALQQYGKVRSHLAVDDHLFIVCGSCQGSILLCIDMNTLEIQWEKDVTSGNYEPGPLLLFENSIVCYGGNQFISIEPESGNVLRSIQIPRVNKLFSPIRLDEENIAIGFTNWSNAGILVYDTVSGNVKWKSGKRFEGPQLRCYIYDKADYLYWTKNDRELICYHKNDGTERFSLPTLPWLYTDLCFDGDTILYGTSGADGFLNCIRFDTGEKIWSLPLKNGCKYFGWYKNTVIVGDFSKTVFQIDAESGKVLQQICTEGEVVGRITVCGDDIYTVVWGNEEKDISLVKIAVK